MAELTAPSAVQIAALPEPLVELARAAGEAILAVYNHPVAPDVMIKADESPLTQADIASHHCLAAGLLKLLDIPLVSEEAELPEASQRQAWPAYWLIDPLDGTKEFIARNGEFTVNIALMMANVPVLGVVHVPVTDTTYVGLVAHGQEAGLAEKWVKGERLGSLKASVLAERRVNQESLRIVASHRHGAEAVDQLIYKLETLWPAKVERVAVGSSLKFCIIAEGKADIYPRFAPTCEWDTAAAQAVLVAAGGTVVQADDLRPMQYNRADPHLLNPWFVALSDPAELSLVS